MKRVKAACLLQTIHFQLKDGLEPELAVKGVLDEFAQYKAKLEQSGTAYVIDEEQVQADGSIMIRIRKQYNTVNVGEYLN